MRVSGVQRCNSSKDWSVANENVDKCYDHESENQSSLSNIFFKPGHAAIAHIFQNFFITSKRIFQAFFLLLCNPRIKQKDK
jgi:hypothetical protein